MMLNKYYLKWLVLCGANLLCMMLCYLTNWFVVLFADTKGNLPKIFKLWQTYDNCLDVAWMIYEGNVPKFARYDFNKHYLYHFENKGDGYMIPGYVDESTRTLLVKNGSNDIYVDVLGYIEIADTDLLIIFSVSMYILET